ncbi:alkaline phosphatase [Portibacter marinus]|uniref:alkaline phosphatase n=1 Tax=Portibacter marinus TaxID=2898660 RepID=UPI001F3D00B2|nr:alkaline phosphatase [Portibacter marinus]
MKYLLITILLVLSCTTTRNFNSETVPKKPENIILLIGDGMGLTQISAGLYMNDNYLNIERFPVVGLHKNYAYDNLVTDSAAGATAFSCGVKTYNGAIGVTSDTIPCKTILESAAEQGLKTGLVASSSIVHATPASFAAHNRLRRNYEEIALDMIDSGVDLMIGGGKSYFDRRTMDSLDLYAELQSSGYQMGNYFEQNFTDFEIDSLSKRMAFLTADKEPLSKQAGRDYLVNASNQAIEFLSKRSDEKGFFLMIEGSQIDWAGHANSFPYLVEEILEYDQVIKDVLDFAEQDGNTLVILTADHETGGLAINYGSKMDSIAAAYTSDYHTATMIPVFAYGPGSEAFAGIYENTAIYHKMMEALNLNKNIGEKIK